MKSRFVITLLLALILLPTAAFAQEACSTIPGCDPVTGVPSEVLEAYPEPDVRPLPVDEKLLADRTYRKVLPGMQVYDVPGGNLLSTVGGYSFVTVESTDGVWSQIKEGEWTQNS